MWLFVSAIILQQSVHEPLELLAYCSQAHPIERHVSRISLVEERADSNPRYVPPAHRNAKHKHR